MLAESVPAMTPPPDMLGNLLAAARQNPPKSTSVQAPVPAAVKVVSRPAQWSVSWRLVAASLALFLVLTNAFWLYQTTRPAVREIKLWDAADAATSPLRCRIVLFPNTPSAVMIAQNFPVLEEGRTYQMWIRRDGGVVSLGVFDVDGFGSGMLTFPADILSSSFESIGVTIEPLGGSSEPTSPSVVRWQSL
jgi:anti-sigma-K factor RskA